MIQIPTPESLRPTVRPLANGQPLYLFPSKSTDLLRIDLLFEAGASYQEHFFCASAANKLLSVATREKDAARMAEFMDYRGVVIETSNDVQQSSLSAYMLRRFAPEVLPVMLSMLTGPAFHEEDFVLWKNKKRMDLAALEQRAPEMARRLFYKNLFGSGHPLGMFAGVKDIDSLELDMVKRHHRQYYAIGRGAVVLAGNIDDELIELTERLFSDAPYIASERPLLSNPSTQPTGHFATHVPGATQTTLRVGRVLPLRWDDPEYARVLLLTTLLGGYFGSRLMRNIREEKGYTYGIYAHTQAFRGNIIFFITSDLAPDSAEDAEKEIMKELEGLRHIGDEELQRVKTIFAADFIRSIDGIFERSARFCDMHATCIDERLTANFRSAIDNTTAADLEKKAVRLLAPESMIVCRAGQVE